MELFITKNQKQLIIIIGDYFRNSTSYLRFSDLSESGYLQPCPISLGIVYNCIAFFLQFIYSYIYVVGLRSCRKLINDN